MEKIYYKPLFIQREKDIWRLVMWYLVIVAELLAPVDPAVGEDDDVPVGQFHCLSHTVGVTAKKVNSQGKNLGECA